MFASGPFPIPFGAVPCDGSERRETCQIVGFWGSLSSEEVPGVAVFLFNGVGAGKWFVLVTGLSGQCPFGHWAGWAQGSSRLHPFRHSHTESDLQGGHWQQQTHRLRRYLHVRLHVISAGVGQTGVALSQ